ncbi:uncharacterized protein LOC114299798 [Camellia sinensis]|uniref:uncharacterized protein LOC114299798 n=1 Tax=Camellia sinensis TaxID=4442 RepID=UPI0010358E37|nr:uncharacterized protein LOC114299798 [Camellia sinensis]
MSIVVNEIYREIGNRNFLTLFSPKHPLNPYIYCLEPSVSPKPSLLSLSLSLSHFCPNTCVQLPLYTFSLSGFEVLIFALVTGIFFASRPIFIFTKFYCTAAAHHHRQSTATIEEEDQQRAKTQFSIDSKLLFSGKSGNGLAASHEQIKWIQKVHMHWLEVVFD